VTDTTEPVLIFPPHMQPTAYKEDRLIGLKMTANDEHLRVLGSMDDALYHANQAGKALAEARAMFLNGNRKSEGGAWSKWLKANFHGHFATAYQYMQVAEHYDTLKAMRDSSSATKNFNTRRALREIANPATPEDEVEPDPFKDDEANQAQTVEETPSETEPEQEDAAEEEDPQAAEYEPEQSEPEQQEAEPEQEEDDEQADLPDPNLTRAEDEFYNMGKWASFILSGAVTAADFAAAAFVEPGLANKKIGDVRQIALFMAEALSIMEQNLNAPLKVIKRGRH